MNPYEQDVFEPCDAQSPDGVERCNLGADHDGDEHRVEGYTAIWQLSERCENPKCPLPPTPGDYACEHGEVPPNTWWSSTEFDSSTELIVHIRWPKRPDDFDDEGEPTNRRREWRRELKTRRS